MHDGLTTEQRENSFTNEDLQSMIAGNNPHANLYREVLGYRETSRIPLRGIPPAIYPDASGSYFYQGRQVLPTWARGFNACRDLMIERVREQNNPTWMAPHQYRELVNQVRDTAEEFAGTQQLRERLAHTFEDCGLLPDHSHR